MFLAILKKVRTNTSEDSSTLGC